MFIETSSPRRPGDNAVLMSTSQTGTKCLSFWYHMFGPHIDRLTIATLSNNKIGPALWQLKGTQGNKWANANVTINSNKTLNNYQVCIFFPLQNILQFDSECIKQTVGVIYVIWHNYLDHH